MGVRLITSIATLVSGFVALAMSPGASFAHHAFTAQYDPEERVAVTGVVVKVEWLNPHAYFYVDVTGDDGGITTWACELTSPVGLMRRGWTRNSLAIGDVVRVDGSPARDGSTSLNARSVVLTSTGQRLFGRSREEEQQLSDSGASD